MNINLYAPIGSTGYGNVSINLLKALTNAGNSVCLTNIGNPMPDNQEDALLIKTAIDLQEEMDFSAPCIKIWHQFDLAAKIGHGLYVAYPFFEIDTFNKQEYKQLQCPDVLVASSKWAKEILVNNGLNQKIHIVHLGVNNNIFTPVEIQNKPKNFIFLTVGKWEIRKGHDVIIECFNKAFTNKDDVELWMITQNPFLNENQEKEWISLVNNSQLRNKIKVFPRLPSQKNIAEAMSYSDCGLYLSRAEGWNLELLETMAMNKPIIATNYSAHTEYCNSNNSYLVDINEKEKAYDGKWFHGTGNWAKIDELQKTQIIDYMRHIYNNKINTNPYGVETAKEFTWENSAKQMLRCITE